MPATRERNSSFTPYTEDTLVVSAARTTSSQTGSLTGYGACRKLRVILDVTAASGTTPTLNVVVEDLVDPPGAKWATIGTFVQKTAAGFEVINITTPFADNLRIRWTVAGTTPSFTFKVVACSFID